MPCCGKKRAKASQTTQSRRVPEPAESASMWHPPAGDIPAYFQYLGKTGLTVTGPKTRKRYRFDRPGAVIAVDPRDGYALAAVSVLRQVERPTEAVRPG